MTELATALAPTETGQAAPSAGTEAAQGSQPASQPSNPSPSPAAAAPGGALNPENSEWIQKKGFKTNDDIVTSLRNAESRLGNSVELPGDDAPIDAVTKFRQRLGVPDKPDGYELKLNTTLPEDFPYPEEDVAAFKSWAHEAGLTPKQAQALHDKFVEAQVGQLAGVRNAQVERLVNTQNELIKANGPQQGDKFQKFMAEATRGLGALDKEVPGFTQELMQLGALVTGEDGKPYPASHKVLQVLAKFGSLVAEDGSLVGSGSAAAHSNPYRRGTPQFSLTEQAALEKSNPALAKRLYVEAGGNPNHFGR